MNTDEMTYVEGGASGNGFWNKVSTIGTAINVIVALLKDNRITIAGKESVSRFKECQSGFIMMSTRHTNTGIILVPDSC